MKKYFGDNIEKLANIFTEKFSAEIDMDKLSSDRDYIIWLREKLFIPEICQKAPAYDEDDIINQIYFQIDASATPQLGREEFCAGVCLENIGDWKVREHNLTHIKDIVEENPFFKWWYFECIRMGVPGWTRVYFDSYLEKNVVTYCTPVYKNEKTLIGVLGIDLDYIYFTNKINQRMVDNIRNDIETVRKERESIGDTDFSEHRFLDINTLELVSNEILTGTVGLNSSAMYNVNEMIKSAVISDATVLLQGETGVGKDYIARNIHDNSKMANGPFVNVNCCALSENLIESELFGYGKGSFTGAAGEGKAGFFEAANGGTLVLNEIGDLPLHLQAKLLNVIHDKEVIRVGETKGRRISVRLIIATNKNLYEMVKAGEFREDLYYRINVLPITIPPLRERTEDIFTLFVYFLQQTAAKYNVKKTVAPEVFDIFLRYSWPGNVRELENVTELMVITSPGEVITATDIPASVTEGLNSDSYSDKAIVNLNSESFEAGADAKNNRLKQRREDAEAQLVRELYAELKSSYKVADALGISQSSAYKKIKKYVKDI